MYKIIDKNKARLHRHLRFKSIIIGSMSRPRVSVFRSNKQIYAEIVDDATHTTLCSASSLGMKLTDGGNKEGAAKVGEELAKKAKELKIETVVFDRSGYLYHGRVQALAEALRKGGLKF